jgi:hypothetical protein
MTAATWDVRLQLYTVYAAACVELSTLVACRSGPVTTLWSAGPAMTLADPEPLLVPMRMGIDGDGSNGSDSLSWLQSPYRRSL